MSNVKNLAVCVIMLALMSQAAAVTHYVNPGDSIQAAINTATSGDEIEVAPGTYNEAINFYGKAIRLYSKEGRGNTTIDASGKNTSAVKCTNSEGSGTVLEGFTITGGTGTVSGLITYGGGMYNYGTNPTVTDCTFTGNSANEGGGMYNHIGSPNLTNCNFSNNEATDWAFGTGQGGGIHNSTCSPTLMNCTFSSNKAQRGTFLGGLGGGMYNYHSSPYVSECTFSGNEAEDAIFFDIPGRGGGMYNESSSPEVTNNCNFSSNAGNGMFNCLGSSPTVTSCSFSGDGDGMANGEFGSPSVANCNFSGGDNGMVNEPLSNPSVADCTFSSNQSGIYNQALSSSTINGCTFNGNISGIWNSTSSNSTVTNCAFAGNSHTGIWNESLSSSSVTNSTFSDSYWGMMNWSCNPTIINCTFSNNTYGIQNNLSGPSITNCTITGSWIGIDNTLCFPTITNCILWNNTSSIVDYGANPSVTYSNVQGGLIWFPDPSNIDVDPQFADTSGRLSPGSPCIDTGNNSAVDTAIDLDGNPRMADGNFDGIEIVDMGAYECVDIDADDDGIENSIDTEPDVYSDDFDDGTTFGTILDRKDQTLIVLDEPSPLGVKIEAIASVGAEPAQVSICDKAALMLDAGDAVIETCGSVEIIVVQGTVEIVFFADDGTEAQTTLNTGNGIEFKPETFTFFALETSTEDIIVIVEGVEIILAPGEMKMFIRAVTDIDPDVLNLKNKGGWITCYIELPEGFDVCDIDLATVILNGQVPAELHPTAIGDSDGDGIADLMIKFDRSATQATVDVGDAIQISVAGELIDGTVFKGSDIISVIEPVSQNK